MHRSVFDHVLYGQFTPNTYFRAPRGELREATRKAAVNKISSVRSPGTAQHLVNPCSFSSFYAPLLTAASGDFQGAHWRMWEKVHGYIEGRPVFCVDSMLSIDFMAQPSKLLVKTVGPAYHLSHPKTSHKTESIRYTEGFFIPHAKSGRLSCDMTYKRDTWVAWT